MTSWMRLVFPFPSARARMHSAGYFHEIFDDYLRPRPEVGDGAEELEGVSLLGEGVGGRSDSSVRLVHAAEHLWFFGARRADDMRTQKHKQGRAEAFVVKTTSAVQAPRKGGKSRALFLRDRLSSEVGR